VTVGDVLDRVARAGGDADRIVGTEADGLDLLEAAGIPVPHRVRVDGPGNVGEIDLSAFPGDRVVVKVVSATIAHKTEVGGVEIVALDREAIREAVARMGGRLGGPDARGFLVCAYVAHADEPGAQLLVALRRTVEFGPVIAVGFGGVHAEALAASLRPDRALAIVPAATCPAEAWVRAVATAAAVPLAVEAHRGAPPRMDASRLGAILAALAGLADDPRIEELEINPLAAGPDGPVALDALLRVRRSAPRSPSPRSPRAIERLVRPRSIAVLGVSARGTNPGRIALGNIVRAGFDRDALVAIKPDFDAIDGVRCVADLASLPRGAVDLLIVAVDAAQVADVVEEVCRDRRAESLIVIPGGLGETAGSQDRADRIRAAVATARATDWGGPVINGGNCLGIRSRAGRYDTLFIPDAKLPAPATRPSPLALLSQSGAFAIAAASRLGPAQPDLLVTFGNQVDLTVGDWIEHVERDPDLRVVACYVEGFRPGDGRRFLAAASRMVARGRTVILYRAGRTPEGAGAAASHTASIAGDWATTRALARGAGVLVAEDLDSFHDLVRTFTLLDGRPARGDRLGAVSNAGFECVAIADALGALRLAELSDDTRGRLDELLAARRLRGVVGVRNPLDVTPILDDAGFARAAGEVLDDPNVDVGLIGCVPLSGALRTLPPGDRHDEDLYADGAVAARILEIFRASSKPCVAVVDAGPAYDPLAAHLSEGGLPTFRSADRALRALSAWVERARPTFSGTGEPSRTGTDRESCPAS